MTNQPTLSKSRYLSGDQCHLRLWYDSHERDLAPPPDAGLQTVFDTGHEVGRLACERHPGGHFVAHDHRHVRDALEETRQVIEAGTAPALFEPAFRHRGVLVRVDILERLPGGGWRLGEVKSTARLKDVNIPDVAVQLWVLRGVGLDVREAEVVTLNRNYVYDGVRLDLDALFKRHPVMDEVEALQEKVSTQVGEMLAMLAQRAAPNVSPSDHCFTPYDCPYYGHCTRDFVWPEHGIDELPSLHPHRRAQLEEAGIEEICEVPAEFSLTTLQRVVRQAVREQRAIIHGNVSAALAGLAPPIRYLDFETFAPAIPRFAGTSPYDSVPFLFSVHTEHAGASLEHTDYLHEQDDDPRPHINTVYHPEFHGSFSIKNVLPVLVPGMGYDDLDIPDGRTASAQYMQALRSAEQQERQQTFDSLRAYCERDTLAMVRLRQALDAL